MNFLTPTCVLLTSYLLGSLSFATLIARSHGIDIFSVGSGNPGATNVKRVLGKTPGNLVFALDCLKGFVGTAWPLFLSTHLLPIIGLIGVLLGHSFSLFIGFRGGKGVAVIIGGLLALMPVVLLIGLFIWVLLFYTTRYVSLASLGFGLALPLSALFLKCPLLNCVLAVTLCLFILIRHIPNLHRLFQGKENRFSRLKK